MTVLALPVSSRDHSQGLETAAVTLVEYGDYQCPHCAEAHQIVRSLQQQLQGQIQFVFRHFPCPDLHPQAQQAAEAVEAAAGQGQFWQMHHCLFTQQHALEAADLVEYAAVIGLDAMQFLRDLADRVYADRVQQDTASGIASGVNHTPTFFINRTRYDGSWDKVTLMSVLRQHCEVPQDQCFDHRT
ncbi:thioredoxin domain-containing protein [Pseudanabaena sp. FACHB-2040]|uniref:DsbA family protein n=1 Tax=Pseudanabaena sp. FACHB-2040 TaxID=2692859 RepID=UPI0032201081